MRMLKFWDGSSLFVIKWKRLNVMTLGQAETDNIKQQLQINFTVTFML